MTTTDPRPEFPEMRRRFGTPTAPVERVDHAAEAARLLDEASKQGNAGLRSLGLRTADVHATLALVEQQRIANLIEVSRDRHENVRGAASGGGFYIDADGSKVPFAELIAAAVEVDTQIREGLGLA